MRFIKTIAFFLIILLQSCGNDRQNTAETNLDKVGEITVACPDAVEYLPDFPAFEDKDAFFNDSVLYKRGYAMRDSERGRQAVLDAGEELDFYLKRFGEVMGVNLSEKQTPAIARYIKTAYSFARKGISNAKSTYARMRPFHYFGEPSGIPEDEEREGIYTSYPSGHSVRAWAAALALTAIDDEHKYDIINLGYELGQSRVITGFHYQSDVDAGRMAASVAFAKIVSDEEFIKLMNLAREELKGLRNRKSLCTKTTFSMKAENKYMQMAIDEAMTGITAGHGGPFGTVIVKDGEIIARGHNRVLKNNDPTCHGEIDAIRRAASILGTFDLTGCTLYTTGEPCHMCLCACMWANIEHIYYGCNIEDNGMIGFRDDKFDEIFSGRDKLTHYMEELDREACLELFDKYSAMQHELY